MSSWWAADSRFSSPNGRVLQMFGASGAFPVFFRGDWWTVLSASWLHGSLLHILFNMMWVRELGPATSDIIGPSRTIIIYTSPASSDSSELAGVCVLRGPADPVSARRAVTLWGPQRRSSDCSARWCTTGARAAAA